MKIKANIKYPPPPDEASELTLEDACKLINAITEHTLVAEVHIASLETVLRRCRTYFDCCQDQRYGTEWQLLTEIDEVLK